MKKILALILLAAMSISIFSACSSGNAPKLMAFMSTDDGVMDLMQKDVLILQDSEGVFGNTSNTLMYDALVSRIDEIENKYNCNIVLESGGSTLDNYEQRVMLDTISGEASADILQGRGGNMMHYFAYNKMLYPLTELKDYIDYEDSEKFGVPGVLEAAMVNGVPYAVQPCYWIGSQSNACFFVPYNIEMIKSQSLTDLHEYYENGTWTWDNFENTINSFDNSSRENLYAFSAPVRGTAQLALYSNGVKYVEKINGEYRCDILEPYSVTAVEWVQKLYLDYSDKVNAEEDYWDVSTFVHENTLMTIASGSAVSSGQIQYSADFEFGIMPFPCGPDGNYGEWAQWIETINGFAIPAYSDTPESAASIISDLFEPLDGFGNTEGLKEYFNQYVFFSETDTEIYYAVSEFIRYRYWRGTYKADQLAFEIGNNYASKTAIEMLQSYERPMMLVIEDEIKPNYENYIYEHLYGEE